MCSAIRSNQFLLSSMRSSMPATVSPFFKSAFHRAWSLLTLRYQTVELAKKQSPVGFVDIAGIPDRRKEHEAPRSPGSRRRSVVGRSRASRASTAMYTKWASPQASLRPMSTGETVSKSGRGGGRAGCRDGVGYGRGAAESRDPWRQSRLLPAELPPGPAAGRDPREPPDVS